MVKRPYFSKTTAELFDIFSQKKEDKKVLSALLTELKFRNKPKAVELRIRVEKALAGWKEPVQAQLPIDIPTPSKPAASVPAQPEYSGLPTVPSEKAREIHIEDVIPPSQQSPCGERQNKTEEEIEKEILESAWTVIVNKVKRIFLNNGM